MRWLALQWFWHPNSDQALKSVDQLLEIWENSVGPGGQLMLGIAPDKRGLLADADVLRLQEPGQAIKANYGADRIWRPAISRTPKVSAPRWTATATRSGVRLPARIL
ncbi:hypothetical protein BJD12_06265 [Xanthomonas vesicatoria ATCC 35937]|uniref:alpha-L-fucosidase n=1 Tax=Xanthomonas vesicatoria ATCC 35937 TaxID=925775 RepID=F0B8G1_9XANT|nr:alpha-L-fucosidase [Xanthomonas vesicatoria]APP74925.1 hypothetical protein BJD12_06265 [Xanthomonas vesicatoria ATCC 35937]EGD11287.1 hypothetical protein XVE_0357 [Xanthomonas vesicatoria ATCC 35937]KTF31039.1 hypothetical protein LMG919_20190 [Xanthomonas vesicatoria]